MTRVLVVDDDEMNRRLFQRLLAQVGITDFRMEASAEELDQVVDSFDPDVVLLDLHLRGSVDGFEALRTMAARPEGTPARRVVLVTGDTTPEVESQAIAMGAAGVLVKPFRVAEFAALFDVPSGLPVESASAMVPSSPANGESHEMPDVSTLIGSSPGSYVVLDADLSIVAVTEDYLRESLTTRDEILGRGIFDVFPGSQQLQEANRRLAELETAKNEMLSRMNHELRTPLTAILGFSELLRTSELDTDQHEFVETIVAAGRHLLSVLDDVLDSSRRHVDLRSLAVEPTSVVALIQDVYELVRPLATSRGITVEVDYGRHGHRYVMADRQRLRQVLLNLVSNAIKYNRPEGRVTITLEVRPEARLALTVTDTGKGIGAEDRARMFQPFEPTGADDDVEGTGVGLALSRELTEGMGGSLSVASTPDVGSTFSVELRIVEPAVVEEPRRDRAIETRTYARPRRILYVEDLVANIRLVERMLDSRPSVSLIPAMLGGVAFDLAREHRPDLILLDLHLPDLSGEDVLRRLRADRLTAGIPVVILSADATRDETELQTLGAMRYLTKPIDLDELIGVIDEILDTI